MVTNSQFDKFREAYACLGKILVEDIKTEKSAGKNRSFGSIFLKEPQFSVKLIVTALIIRSRDKPAHCSAVTESYDKTHYINELFKESGMSQWYLQSNDHTKASFRRQAFNYLMYCKS
jgi:hypothetical protein